MVMDMMDIFAVCSCRGLMCVASFSEASTTEEFVVIMADRSSVAQSTINRRLLSPKQNEIAQSIQDNTTIVTNMGDIMLMTQSLLLHPYFCVYYSFVLIQSRRQQYYLAMETPLTTLLVALPIALFLDPMKATPVFQDNHI